MAGCGDKSPAGGVYLACFPAACSGVRSVRGMYMRDVGGKNIFLLTAWVDYD